MGCGASTQGSPSSLRETNLMRRGDSNASMKSQRRDSNASQNSAFSISPLDEAISNMYAMGKEHYSAGRFDKALASFSSAAESLIENGEDPDMYRNLKDYTKACGLRAERRKKSLAAGAEVAAEMAEAARSITEEQFVNEPTKGRVLRRSSRATSAVGRSRAGSEVEGRYYGGDHYDVRAPRWTDCCMCWCQWLSQPGWFLAGPRSPRLICCARFFPPSLTASSLAHTRGWVGCPCGGVHRWACTQVFLSYRASANRTITIMLYDKVRACPHTRVHTRGLDPPSSVHAGTRMW